MPLIAALALLITAAPPADFEHAEEGPLLALAYSWPAAVEAEPALARHMRALLAGERRQALTNAAAQRRAARRGRYIFEPHSIVESWRVEGSTARLIALSAEAETFTGGGHGNHDFSAVLWDRAAGREADPRVVFGPAGMARLAARFCPARTAVLREHPGEVDAQCPRLAELVMSPVDGDGNGRFERLRVFIATGYFDADGQVVDLAFEPEDLAGIASGLRPAFETSGD